jgi:hypothetical protein
MSIALTPAYDLKAVKAPERLRLTAYFGSTWETFPPWLGCRRSNARQKKL